MIAVTVDSVETAVNRRRFIRDFIRVPKRIYHGDPYWLPWFDRDIKSLITKKHPFFEHSEGSFYVAYRDGEPVGRIGVVHNTRYCKYHDKWVAHFCFIDFENDHDVVHILVEAAAEWSRKRGLQLLEGPMFAGGIYGSGFKSSELVQISEQTEMMLKDLQRLGADFYKTYRMFTHRV